MMKLQLIYLTLWSVSQAAYMSRMAVINHGNQLNRIRPTAFRPGVMMRPWTHPRLVQAASHRVPYVFYRNSPHRYAVKQYTPTRVFSSPWKATRLTSPPAHPSSSPAASTPSSAEYEFVRAASAQPLAHAHSDGGAIHTIPAPNLSLSEKPIVVVDTITHHHGPSSENPKVYEVTEKYSELFEPAKIEQPIGFSKATSLTTPELQSLVRNGAALQLASDLGLSAISLPQNALPHPLLQQQTITPNAHQPNFSTNQNLFAQSIMPQQFALQSFNSLPNPQSFNSLPNPQGFNGPPNPQGFNGSPNPHGYNGLLNPHGFNSLTNPQGFNGLANPQSFSSLQSPQEMIQAGPDGIVISPSALYQPDPGFLQKLQTQLLQRFPGVEFVPYPADLHQAQVQNAQSSILHPQVASPPQNQQHIVHQQEPAPSQNQQQPLFLLQNEQIAKHTPSSFVAAESQNLKSVVQRGTQEGTVVTLVPQFVVANATEKQSEVTSASTPQNITVELVSAGSQPEGSTVKYFIETTTEEQKTTPVFVTQVTNQPSLSTSLVPVGFTAQSVENSSPIGLHVANVQVSQNVGNVETDGFYSAINDVRAAAALAQVEKPQEQTVPQENITTTTINPTSTINSDIKAYFVQQTEGSNQNKTGHEIKPPSVGVPFAKTQNSVAYTLLRTDDKEAKVAKDGSVYAGQIVEASVSEDADFNVQKANLLTRRAPIRLVAVTENKEATQPSTTTTVRVPAKMTIVKAKIPPKSKLTFDDKTGEPVLRIYASYVDSPNQRETIASKLTNIKHIKEIVGRKQDTVDSWKGATIKALAKPFEANQVSQFGLKLKARSDDYVPLFGDYED